MIEDGSFSTLSVSDFVDGWVKEPIYEGDELVGEALIRGPEIHLNLKRKLQWHRHIAHYRETLARVIGVYGCVWTAARRSYVSELEFLERIGFVVVEDDGSVLKLIKRSI